MSVNRPYHNEVFDANKVFFTADLHFGHKNIIKYCNRPHSSVDIMNERIVNLWNKYIPDELKSDSISIDLGYSLPEPIFSVSMPWDSSGSNIKTMHPSLS